MHTDKQSKSKSLDLPICLRHDKATDHLMITDYTGETGDLPEQVLDFGGPIKQYERSKFCQLGSVGGFAVTTSMSQCWKPYI